MLPPRFLPSLPAIRKGQALIEFLIVFPVMFIMISIFYSFYMHMIYWENAQAHVSFILRATSTDAYVQKYTAEECAGVIQQSFPGTVFITTSGTWSQANDPILASFNLMQPLDPCYLETVKLTLTYQNLLSRYSVALNTIVVGGATWTSWANQHFTTYASVMQILMEGIAPVAYIVQNVMELFGSLPDWIVWLIGGH